MGITESALGGGVHGRGNDGASGNERSVPESGKVNVRLTTKLSFNVYFLKGRKTNQYLKIGYEILWYICFG